MIIAANPAKRNIRLTPLAQNPKEVKKVFDKEAPVIIPRRPAPMKPRLILLT